MLSGHFFQQSWNRSTMGLVFERKSLSVMNQNIKIDPIYLAKKNYLKMFLYCCANRGYPKAFISLSWAIFKYKRLPGSNLENHWSKAIFKLGNKTSWSVSALWGHGGLGSVILWILYFFFIFWAIADSSKILYWNINYTFK